MATYRANLVFAPSFSRPNVWALAKDESGVVVRFKLGAKEEVLALPFSDVELREFPAGVWNAKVRVEAFGGVPGGVELALRGGTPLVDQVVREATRRARNVASRRSRA